MLSGKSLRGLRGLRDTLLRFAFTTKRCGLLLETLTGQVIRSYKEQRATEQMFGLFVRDEKPHSSGFESTCSHLCVG